MSYIYANKGTYFANNKPFFNKMEAIVEANTNSSHVGWNFYDEVFSKSKWDVEPSRSLEQLYLDRAIQLRESYDYLVLAFSGGVDSANILSTFVKNGIKLDELFMYGAFSAEEKAFDTLGLNRDPGYYTREVVNALPLVKKVAAEHNIKVNVYDWTNDVINGVNDLDWFWREGKKFGPDAFGRFQFHKNCRAHNELLHKGKRVGYIYGVDKPRLLRDDQNIYFAFLDLIMTTGNVSTNDILGEYWENDEFFYWTPNMPELAIKQSHEVVRWLTISKQLDLIKTIDSRAAHHDEIYYNQVNKIIYPDWDQTTWQVKKPTSAAYSELCKWFIDSDLDARKMWESSLQEVERICGAKWFNKDSIKYGMRGHLSPLYKVSAYPPTLPG